MSRPEAGTSPPSSAIPIRQCGFLFEPDEEAVTEGLNCISLPPVSNTLQANHPGYKIRHKVQP